MKNMKLVMVSAFLMVMLVACSPAVNKEKMDDKMGDMKSEKMDDMKSEKMDDMKSEKMDDMKSEKTDDMKSEKTDDMKMENKSDMKSEKTDDMKMENKSDMKSEKTDDMKMENKSDMKSEKTDDMKMENKSDMKSEKTDDMKMSSEKMNDGEMAQDFTLVDKDSMEFSLSANKGKKVYVKFWASWCSICLAGLEELNTLSGEDNDFEIVTVVSPGTRGEKNKDEFIKWFDTLGYSNIKVLFDEGGQVSQKYGVRAYPRSAMIGSDGVLAKFQLGHIGNDEIKKNFETIK